MVFQSEIASSPIANFYSCTFLNISAIQWKSLPELVYKGAGKLPIQQLTSDHIIKRNSGSYQLLLNENIYLN